MARPQTANPRTLPRRPARAVVLCGLLIVCAVLFSASHGAKAQTLAVLSSSNYTQNFDSLGSSASTNVPTGWFITTTSTNFTGTTNVTQAYGTVGTGVVAGNSGGGVVNWGNGTNASATDRALGFLNTGSYTTGKSLAFGFTNNTGSSVTNLSLAWDYEKYRSGSRAWTWTFAYSTNGSSWITNASGGQAYAADANNTTVNNPPTAIAKSFSIGSLSIGNGSSVYLRWTLDGDGGSSNGQGLAVDNFSMTASYSPALPPGNFWAGAAGGGGSGIWTSTSTNWATGANGSGRGGQQATSGALVFTNTAGTVDVGGPVSVNAGMQFATDGYTVQSNTITLAGANVAANTITTEASVGTTINSVLAGTAGMTKAGAGTLTLGGANTYSGGTLVSAGALIGSTTSLQGAITNNAAVTFNQSTNGTYSGVLSGNGSLLKTNAGTLTLSGNSSSFAGAVSIAAGAVRVSNAGALGNTTGSTTVSSGAALELTVSPGAEAISLAGSGLSSGGALRNISGNNTLSGLLTLTAATRINSDADTLTLDVASGAAINGTHNLTIGGAGNVTIADNINISTGTLTKDGAGVLTLSGVNTYTGATTINDGRLIVSGSTAAGSAVAVNSGGTLGGGGTVGGAVTINSGGTVSPGTSPGTLTVGSMTFGGGGHYNWQLHDATGTAGTGWDLIDSAGAFTFNNTAGSKFNINLWTLSAVSPDANGNAINFSGANNYSWLIAQSGSVISGFDAAAFNINTAANNGTDGFANPFTGTFSLSLNEAETGILLSYVGAAPAATNAWTGGGTGMGSAWRSGANWGAGVMPATNAIAEFGAAGVAGVGINMNQASGLQQVGRVDLTGGVDRRLTNSSGVDGTFQINGVGGKLLVNSTAANSLTLSNGTNAMDVRFTSAGEIEVVNAGARILIGSTIIGTNGFTKTGAGTLQLTASNSFTGNVVVSGGTLSLDANGALAANSNITINAGGTLRSGVAGLTNAINEAAALTVAGNGIINLAGGTERVGSIASGSSAASLVIGDSGANSGSLTVGDGTSTTFEGVISGTRAGAGPILTKTGSGTLTLAGANTYGGATTIAGGTLRIDGNSRLGNTTSTLTISNAAVLEVTAAGTLTNAITIGAGNGVLSNSSAGALVIAGNVDKNGTVLTSRSGSGTNVFTGVISGASANSDFIVDGGTTVFSNQMTYNGPTIITNGGTLVLGTNNATPEASGLVLGGGTLLIGDATTRYSTTFASLTLTADSTIDMGANGELGTLTFGNSSGPSIVWANNAVLTIANWQGAAASQSEVTKLLFGTGGLDSEQLAQIQFAGYEQGSLLIEGELAPIPEAPVVWGAAAVVAFIFWRERRRLIDLLRSLRPPSV